MIGIHGTAGFAAVIAGLVPMLPRGIGTKPGAGLGAAGVAGVSFAAGFSAGAPAASGLSCRKTPPCDIFHKQSEHLHARPDSDYTVWPLTPHSAPAKSRTSSFARSKPRTSTSSMSRKSERSSR